MEILHQVDTLIKVQRILDASLIMADENLMALRQISDRPVHLPKTFIIVPQSEPPFFAATTTETDAPS